MVYDEYVKSTFINNINCIILIESKSDKHLFPFNNSVLSKKY